MTFDAIIYDADSIRDAFSDSFTNNVLRIDDLSEEDAVQLACIFTDHGIGICLLPRKE